MKTKTKKAKTEPLWTVMAWSDERILIRRGVAEADVDLCRSNMQTTLEIEDSSDPRWQAWEGHAKVEVI